MARRMTSAIGRRILAPSASKAMSILREITEGDLRSPARAKATMDPPRYFFPTAVWLNFNWTLLGVALLVSITILDKSSQTLLYFFVGRLARSHDFLNIMGILVAESV